MSSLIQTPEVLLNKKSVLQPMEFVVKLIRSVETSLAMGQGIGAAARVRNGAPAFERWEDDDYVYLGATLPEELPSIDVNCEGRSILIRVARPDFAE
jgi:hypothetical protein